MYFEFRNYYFVSVDKCATNIFLPSTNCCCIILGDLFIDFAISGIEKSSTK